MATHGFEPGSSDSEAGVLTIRLSGAIDNK